MPIREKQKIQKPETNVVWCPAPVEQKIWRSEELFGEAREILIAHGGARYRLIRTRAGKLILNK